MKKFYFLLAVLPFLYSCSQEYEELDSFLNEKVDQINTRSTGEEKYDVLGYGYDITDEYLGENAVKLQVINVQAFVNDGDNKYRFDNPFIGIIEQNCYAGENAYSFLEDIRTKTDFSGSVASLIDVKKDGFFSGTVSTKLESDKRYSYSSKYSFARAEVFKKQRRYLLNTDIETLSKYLLSSFIEDLNKYSADRIVEMYGTHVLTNITVGGKYTAYYKSVIIEENSSTEKTEIVSAGAKYNLSNIGLDAHGSWSKTEVEERNKKNSNWECYIKALGGSTSGTTITLVPEQGPTFTINLGAWTESVDDQHSRLFDVNWNATYPIYDLISDPIKKQEMKEAVFRYIDSKKIDVIELLPLYQYYSDKYINHSYTTHWRGEVDLTDRYEGVIGYICAKQLPGTTPLYEYYSEKYVNHSYCTNWRGTISGTDRYQGTLGYIYTSQVPGTTPLYGYYSKKSTNHSLSTHWRGTQEGSDACQCTWGYVY